MDNFITVIVASIPAIVAAYFSARFYTRQAKADLQKEFENKLNERKWQTYTEFAGIVRQVLEASKKPQNKRQSDEFATKLMGFAGSLWIVGSDEVIHAFNSWRQSQQGANGGTPNPKEALVKLFEIIVVMRRDLGYSTSRTSARDLLATFVNAMDTMFPEPKDLLR